MVNHFTDKSIAFSELFGPVYLVGIIGLMILTTLLAGFYPAVIISGFRPGRSLRQLTDAKSGHIVLLRKGLVVIQFYHLRCNDHLNFGHI